MTRRGVTMFLAALLWLSLAWPPPASAAQGWDKSVEFIEAIGMIDWVRGVAVASGTGLPPSGERDPARRRALARRAAVIDARRNLLEVIGEVRIDSTTKVVNYMVASDVIMSSVSGRLTGSRIESERPLPDGSYVVEMSVPIQAALTPETAKRAVSEASTEPPAQARGQARGPVPDERDIAEEPAPAAPAAASAPLPDYTGLVIDARGTGFAPSLAPRIMGPGGQLYPSSRIPEEVAAGNGFVRYFTDMSEAQQSDRAGERPLTVKANAAEGGSDLTLSAEDAATLSAILSRPENLLDRARVVVVF